MRIIKYVKENYLSNVEVEFIESDKAKNTVIEQSASGSLKRDDYLKLTFSYGEALDFEEVTLKDFTNMSKFEVEFYMKQNQLNYHFTDAFSNKVKRGYASKQDVKAGEKVKVNDQIITVTISKGPKIKIPEFKDMSMEDITEWAIKNKVKLNFTDKYSDTIKENKVISSDHNTGDIIEQGTVIKVIISRGALKMPKFKSLNDFYTWANKYDIKYEEKHEFSDTIPAGEVISYSYKKGEKINLDEAIIVTISDGKQTKVPDLVGLTKSEAITKLEKANLKYNFIYRNSSKKKNTVIDQSISAGSEISTATTITVSLSNGKGDDEDEDDYYERRIAPSNNNNNNNSNNNTPSSNGGSNNPVTNNCTDVEVYIYDELISNVPSTTCSRIKSAYPSLKFSCSYVQDSGYSNGMLKNAGSIDGTTKNTCNTVNLVIVNNN